MQAKLVEWMPYALTEHILFGNNPLAVPLQKVMQRLIGGPCDASFDLDGLQFHCRTSQKYFFVRDHYERHLAEAFLERLRPGGVLYDVGAHYGFWAVRAAVRGQKVIAFEPSPQNQIWLRKNTANLPVTIIPAAVSNQAGSIEMNERGSMTALGSGASKVTCVVLDELDIPAPTTILIDVEGFAGSVLQGASRLLKQFAPSILIEIHSKQERLDAESQLKPLGYRIATVGQNLRYPIHVVADR